MMHKKKEIEILTENAMLIFGADLARAMEGLTQPYPAFVIYLHGLLGAGKTTLVRGFLRNLKFIEKVKSPTYTLVETYELANQTIYHFDLYRINDPEELTYIGFADYFTDNHICFIEWPEQGDALLPNADLTIHFEFTGDHHRKLLITANSDPGEKIIQQLRISLT